ncbi:MAG: hypothetical protein J7M26_05335 [Armatimonadetes bacterium]|nr:hypothetical protein [Armatimonadota bacterium]
MHYDLIRQRFAEYVTILRPDRDEFDWWAGAPSVAPGPDGRTFLAVRMREAISPRGRRGYEVRLLASDDGVDFSPIAHLKREDVPIQGFERPALVYDAARGLFRLYLCGPWPHDGVEHWCILRLDDVADPADFDPSTARPVLCAPPPEGERDFGVRGYKDPFVWLEGDEYHMVVIGYSPERTYHFVSANGDQWQQVGEGPWFDHGGWHTFFTRPACVLPMGVGWLVVYEGSHPTWYDPPYNIATGLAWTPDLKHVVDLTPDEPLLKSTTPGKYHTWRYSHWLWREGELWVYAEVACANDTNEVRLFRLPVAALS